VEIRGFEPLTSSMPWKDCGLKVQDMSLWASQMVSVCRCELREIFETDSSTELALAKEETACDRRSGYPCPHFPFRSHSAAMRTVWTEAHSAAARLFRGYSRSYTMGVLGA